MQGDNLFIMIDTKKQHKHKSNFGSHNNANKCLELADSFLDSNPELFYWTEPNDSKKGLFYWYKGGVYKPCSTYEIEQKLLKYDPSGNGVIIPKSISGSRLQETMQNVRRLRFFYREAFNPEGIFNFKNGLFDIKKGKLFPHTMDIISTIQLPYEYNEFMECPLFMKLLNDSFEGKLEKIGILQEFLGLCLTRHTKYEKALFMIGEAGSGKSTILEAVKNTFGIENCSNVRLDMLADSRFTGNLLDKYINIDTEIPENIENYEDALKKITSGEEIMINTKFIPTYSARPFCKLIFAANDMPRIKDTSNAIYRRFLLLDFNNVVSDEKIDVELKFKLKDECAGIFNWAYEGYKRLIEKKKFTTSKDMSDKINEIKLLNNSVYYFISENYEITENKEHYIIIDDMYEEYKNFCHKVGAKGIFKKIVFGKEMSKTFLKRIKSDRRTIGGVQKRIWTGLRKLDDVTQMSESEIEQIEWEE